MLYATIVRRKIKRTFREINQGNVQPMLDTHLSMSSMGHMHWEDAEPPRTL